VRYSFLLDIPIGFIERNANEISSKISEKDVIKGLIKAHAFELDIVIDLICDFEVIHIEIECLIFKDSKTVDN
jgi:hypothetical protein